MRPCCLRIWNSKAQIDPSRTTTTPATTTVSQLNYAPEGDASGAGRLDRLRSMVTNGAVRPPITISATIHEVEGEPGTESLVSGCSLGVQPA